MTIEFSCPHCGKLLRTSDDRAGAQALCPECSQTIEVPLTSQHNPAPTVADPLQETVAQPVTPAPLVGQASSSSAGGNVPAFKRNFCSSCGNPISEWIRTCPQCGAPTGGEAVPAGQMMYAGFWIRACAAVLDWIALAIAFGVVGPILTNVPFGPEIGGLSSFLLYGAYFALLESSETQATVGKMLVGIIVTDADGRRLTIPRAIGRYAAKFVSGMTCTIGFLMAAFTDRKRTLHDIIADTVVIYKINSR